MITQKNLLPSWHATPIMPSTKIKAILKEMSWLRQWAGESPRYIYINAISPELLVYKPTFHQYDGLIDTYTTNEKLVLLDAEGKLVTLSTEKTYEVRKHLFWGPKVKKSVTTLIFDGYIGHDLACSSLDGALKMLDEKTALVRFILSSYSITGVYIVYKVPKHHTLLEWMAEEQEKERVAVHEMIEVIDAKPLPVRV